jgi:membrane-bound serine protease (ClpP class)
MMIPLILLFAGLLLIFLEFYLPGGIMGTLGALTILASVILFVMENDSPILILLFIGTTILLVALLIRFTLWKIRTANPESSVYSDADQEGFIASSYDKEAVGKRGVVTTDLRPGGHIAIGKNRYPAISQSGYIPKGEQVDVIGGEGDTLIVKTLKEKHEH